MAPKQPKSQPKRGHLRDEQTNPTKKTGRGDGQGAQKKRGATKIDGAEKVAPNGVRPVPGDNISYGEARRGPYPSERLEDGVESISG
jgi:hypothetical protein